MRVKGVCAIVFSAAVGFIFSLLQYNSCAAIFTFILLAALFFFLCGFIRAYVFMFHSGAPNIKSRAIAPLSAISWRKLSKNNDF